LKNTILTIHIISFININLYYIILYQICFAIILVLWLNYYCLLVINLQEKINLKVFCNLYNFLCNALCKYVNPASVPSKPSSWNC